MRRTISRRWTSVLLTGWATFGFFGLAPTAGANPLSGRLPVAWSGPLCPESNSELLGDVPSRSRDVSQGAAGRSGSAVRLTRKALRRYWRRHGFDVERLERAMPASVRAVADGRQCLAELRRLGVRFRPGPRVRGIAWPVLLEGRVGRLRIHSVYGRPELMDCRMALALYQAAPLFLAAGFDTLHFWSFYSYRNVAHTHRLSRHAFGLAVDVPMLSGPHGKVVVAKDWVHAAGGPTDCIGPVRNVGAARMRGLICRIEAALIFRRILTPDTNYAHRDHIHFSAPRYGEHWVRRSWAGRRLGRRARFRRRSRHAGRRWRRHRRRERGRITRRHRRAVRHRRADRHRATSKGRRRRRRGRSRRPRRPRTRGSSTAG